MFARNTSAHGSRACLFRITPPAAHHLCVAAPPLCCAAAHGIAAALRDGWFPGARRVGMDMRAAFI